MSKKETSLYDLFSAIFEEDSSVSYSGLASEILERYPEVEPQLSFRSLRRYASMFVEGTNFSKTLVLDSNEGSTWQQPGLSQKIDFETLGSKPISLDAAVDRFDIDLDVYQVRNFWPKESLLMDREGNVTGSKWKYTLHVTRKKTVQDDPQDEKTLESLAAALSRGLETFVPRYRDEEVPTHDRTAVVCISDIHGGARVDKTKHTESFSYDSIIERLDKVAHEINRRRYARVVIYFLGDMIDTFSGLNHPDNWMEIHGNGQGMGALAVKHTYRILLNFLSKVEALHEVGMVSGNHDRIGKTKSDDPRGQVAELIAFMLEQVLTPKGVKVDYDPIIISNEYDGIQYMGTHMHLGASKRPMADIILKYGDPTRYNLLVGGHFHNKSVKRYFYETEQNLVEEKRYRVERVSPIFTGNFYSASMGFSGGAGFKIYERGPYSEVVNSTDINV